MAKQVLLKCILKDLQFYLDKHPDFIRGVNTDRWQNYRKAMKAYFAEPNGRGGCCPGWIPSFCATGVDRLAKPVLIQCIFKDIGYYLDKHPDFTRGVNTDKWQKYRKALKSYFADPRVMRGCCPGWIPTYCAPTASAPKRQPRRLKRK